MITKFCFTIASFLLFQTCCLFSITPQQKATVNWQTNYESAVSQSKASSKPLILFFTGSDWCSWCHRLEDEAFNTQEFIDLAGDKFVFLKVDSPLYKPQDPQEKAQNTQLQQKYGIRSYPIVIILDPAHNQKIGEVNPGYRSGGGRAYAEYLLKLVNDYSSYQQKMGALDTTKYTGADIKELYAKAQELDLNNDSARIIAVGMNSDEALFFQLERYRGFANEGMLQSRPAKALRQQLYAADPDNARQIPYHLAVIDFETTWTMMDKDNLPTEKVVAPLVTYVDKFAGKDKENIWRLEMIISQVYLDKNDMENALIHAQASLDGAPTSAKNEIAKAVNSIRGQTHTSLAKKLVTK